MKITALLLIFLGVILLIGFGFMYLLGFAMSFDAPGSSSDPKAWWMRLLMFLPLLLIVLALIFSIIAFAAGNYKRSAIISSVPLGICGILIALLFISSFTSMAKYKAQTAKEAADAMKYPIQKYLRTVEGGTDTIIVFPNRIVAYRKYQGTDIPWAGPLGDLNETRDTLYYHESTDTKIAIGELDQFMDESGRKFTEAYSTINARK